MAEILVWDDKTHLFLGEAIYVHFYVYADTSVVGTDLQHAFRVQATIRAGGILFWDSGRVALQDGPPVAKPDPALTVVTALPVIEGDIQDWDGLDARGTAGQWQAAAMLTFLIASKADVTLPIRTIMAALATLGAADVAASAVLGAAGLFAKRVRVTIGHVNVGIPLQRDAGGKLAQINHVSLTAGVVPA